MLAALKEVLVAPAFKKRKLLQYALFFDRWVVALRGEKLNHNTKFPPPYNLKPELLTE